MFGAGPTSDRQGLAGNSSLQLDGKTNLGALREVAKEGGSGTDHLRNVLPCGGPGCATLWVGNLGVDVSNAAKN